jgi:formate hydrogenlyase subunit 3/multisubunit Na+/H+ antiporter MnhD subunit
MKSMRTILLISGVIVLISLGVVVYMMFWGPDHLELGGRSLSELLKSGDLTPLIVIPIVLIVSAVTILPFLRIMFPAEIKNGVTAQAKVLEVWDTAPSRLRPSLWSPGLTRPWCSPGSLQKSSMTRSTHNVSKS